jgi:hypothetical protein
MAKSMMPLMETNTRKSLSEAGFIGEPIESIIEMTSMKDLSQVIFHNKIMRMKLKINLIVNTKLVHRY